MIMKIEPLALHEKYVTTVIDWLYNEWGNNNPKYWDAWIRSSLNIKEVPITFVILIDDQLAGTFSLWRCDIQSRQDLFPWLGGLFVAPEYRGKQYFGHKLGAIAQQYAIEYSKELGYSSLYLFTEKNPKYYIENGWKPISESYDEKDNPVTICHFSIA